METKIKWQIAASILATIFAAGGMVTYTDLFGVLFQLKGVTASHSGDIYCDYDCPSYIESNTSYWRICFAHYDDTKYEDELLFKKVSRSRTLHVNLDKADKIITTYLKVGNSWAPYNIPVDWLVPARGKDNWRQIKDGDCWDRRKVNRIKLVGHKQPEQTIKWGFNVGEFVNIDPLWIGGSLEDDDSGIPDPDLPDKPDVPDVPDPDVPDVPEPPFIGGSKGDTLPEIKDPTPSRSKLKKLEKYLKNKDNKDIKVKKLGCGKLLNKNLHACATVEIGGKTYTVFIPLVNYNEAIA